MIQYSIPGVMVPLRRDRVRRLSGFALVAYPIGFALFVAGGEGNPPGPVRLGGALLMLAAFVAALFVIPTGIQRIAAGIEQGLDEFQLAARLRAQSNAYRWFSLWALLMVVGATVAEMLGYPFTTADPAFSTIVFWVIAYSTVMPAWFLTGALPDPVDED
ncbi:MAG: hypothetical protein ACKVOB_04025 [Sphingomonas sp.]